MILSFNKSTVSEHMPSSTHFFDALDDAFDDFRIELTKIFVGFLEAIINTWIIADHLISRYEAVEPVSIGGAGRQIFFLVNDDAGKPAFLLVKLFKFVDHFLICQSPAAFKNDVLCGQKISGLDDGFKRIIFSHPFFRGIFDALFLQLEGLAVINIVADIFFVGQNGTDGCLRPVFSQIGVYS